MPTLDDKEFGLLTIRRSARSKSMRATLAPDGSLRLSVPSYAPIFMVKRMIASARPQIRKLLETRPTVLLKEGMRIGKSHTLLIRNSTSLSVKRTGTQLILTLGEEDSITDRHVVDMVRSQMRVIARRESKAYLPRRLRRLADENGLDFTALRFTHASSRWGSCNSSKAISLNIALMNLPYELIDYVLLHELAHTKHLNHSKEFWTLVSRLDPSFMRHRKELKTYSPAI